MDNQHKKIKGYRDLSKEEIDLMNEAKMLADNVKEYIEKLKLSEYVHNIESQRWMEEGTIDLQKGFMCIIRSIAKPTSF